MECQQEDFGVYFQAPTLHLLRNACASVLAPIIVEKFKSTKHIIELEELKSQNGNPDGRQPNQPQIIDVENTNIFQFLKKIHNRGKKQEDKQRKKAGNDVDDQEFASGSRSLHLNNLNDNEDILSKLRASDLMNEEKFPYLINIFSKLDVAFLLNLITNEVLGYKLSDELSQTIRKVKEIRNGMIHSGRKVKCYEERFKQLCSALEVMYNYQSLEVSQLDDKIKEAKKQHEKSKDLFAPQILKELHEEISLKEKAKLSDQQSFIMPPLIDTREEKTVIENLEEFLGKDKLPVLLCGPSGFGKSTILQKLTHKFYSKSHSQKYKMVIYLDSSNRITTQCDFREAVEKKICNCCPKTVEEYGIDLIALVIEEFKDDILFLVNWNVDNLEEQRWNKFGGKWVVCSQHLHIESQYCHVVRVMPLNDALVKKMLKTFIPDSKQYQQVCILYDECAYKGLIDSPDMVAIFSEIRTKTPCNQLLQAYLNKKLGNAQDAENECRALGKITFDHIFSNKNEYSNEVLCDISNKLKAMLLIPRKNNSFIFQYRIIEDLLAAKYIVAEPKEACEKWIKQVPLFKRVFKFVCVEWCENDEVLRKNLSFLRPYLEKKFNVDSSGKHWNRDAAGNRGNRDTADDILNIDSEFVRIFVKNSFTKWPFLISLVEYCKSQRDMIKLVCELLSQKNVWLFKCKFIDEEKVSVLAAVLEKVQLRAATVIRIESGSVVGTLNKILQMLSGLPGLYEFATIHITLMHRECIPIAFESSLPMLPSYITNINKSLYVTKYKGPFMCSTKPDFLKNCVCMRKLEVLDVCVYDVATLAEVLACESLENLKAVVIKVDLRRSEKESVNFTKLRIPILPNKATLTLTIKYFDRLQKLLEQVENPSHVKSLIIHSMRIKENFKLDFSAFENLESLFIRFNPHVAQHYESELSMETNQASKDQECEQPMETDQPCSRAQDIPSCSWAFQLSINLSLPKTLGRLMLRNTGFCNDSNISLMIELWKNNDIQRLTLLDSNISVKGVRDILKSHIPGDTTLEQVTKRHCCISRNDLSKVKECLTKKPRLDKAERDRRRKDKPSGKELIIHSQLKLCTTCEQFPCSCQRLDGVDHRDSLEDVVHLIEDAYHYNILSLSYESEIITVRKDMCDDLRVHCPLTNVDDDTIDSLDNGDQWLKSFFHSLTLAQCIKLDHTKLTYSGAQAVITKIKSLKKQNCNLPDVEPFSLEISSVHHPDSDDEVKNSTFIDFLTKEKSLVQFRFKCCCKCCCKNRFRYHYIKRTRKGKIFLDDECLDVCKL